MSKSVFNSKILLFGEYSIIKESMGLAIPFPLFSGSLKLLKEKRKDLELESLLLHVKNLKSTGEVLNEFDIDLFQNELNEGLIFDSTIPKGYGVGSSGALSAAIFDRYVNKKSIEEYKLDLIRLRQIFSVLESHFHGASSGIDPLISFFNETILIKSKEELQFLSLPKLSIKKGGMFLLDTNRSRRTEPLVNLFLEKCNNYSFLNLCKNVLLPITDSCIQTLLNEDYESLQEFYRELSDFQYRHFSPMIPSLYKNLWREGLKSENYYLKLCGAGGGGFLLGLTSDYQKIIELETSYDVIRL